MARTTSPRRNVADASSWFVASRTPTGSYLGSSRVAPIRPRRRLFAGVLDGTVLATNPIVVETDYGLEEPRQITLKGVDEPVSEGQQISGFGTLTDESTLAVDRAVVRSPWESRYMYAVSVLGGLWVLGRLLTHWRIDRDRLALVPRSDRDG